MKQLPSLPTGWEYVPLGSLIQRERPITYGVVQPGEHDPTGIPLVRGTDFSSGWRPLSEMRRVSPEIEKSYSRARLKAGDLVITIKGDVGTVAEVPEWLNGANLSQTNARLAINPDVAIPRFVLNFLESPLGRRQVHQNTKTGAQPGLIFDDIASFSVPIPRTLAQQLAITEVIDAWTGSIEATRRLVRAKSDVYDRMSYMLLSGRRRLGRKHHNWPSVSLIDVAAEIAVRNKAGSLGSDSVMGVNKLHGMIPMKDHVRADDLSRYKVVPSDAFAYNPMRLNIGSIAQNNHGRDVLVSPDYVAFKSDSASLLPAYFEHLRRTPIWSRFVRSAGSGGVRIRIYYEDLGDFVFDLPSLDEQRRIVDVLDTGRKEIAILEAQRDALIKQKCGLMQKLLTGEWSVPTPKSQEVAA